MADGDPTPVVVLIFVALTVGGLLVAGLVVGVLVRVVTAGSRARLPVLPGGVVTVNAHVFRPSEQFSPGTAWGDARYGTLAVTAEDLVWVSQSGERWQAPLRGIAVTGVHGSMSVASAPSVDIEITGSGPWRLVVSDRQIDRIVANDAKRFREAAVARMVADALVARGATDLRNQPR